MQLHTKNGHWNVWWSIPLKGGGFSWSSSRQQRWITVTSSWAARAERGWGFDSRRSGPDRRCPPERTWPPSFPAPRRSYSSPAATQTQMLQLDPNILLPHPNYTPTLSRMCVFTSLLMHTCCWINMVCFQVCCQTLFSHNAMHKGAGGCSAWQKTNMLFPVGINWSSMLIYLH